ncbi:MAG TPA: hypothetical protein VFF67_03575 [Thermoplasmata archaeon]|nr:hypothetical protein [Thermoplasmata archaeon]
MVGAARVLGPVLLGAGIGLIVHAVLTGQANLALLVIIPVVTGVSAEFFGGALLLVLGVFFLPLTFMASSGAPRPPPPGDDGPRRAGTESGGLILVGPVPIFFGRWRGISGARYWVAVAVGTALLGIALLLFFVL